MFVCLRAYRTRGEEVKECVCVVAKGRSVGLVGWVLFLEG